MKNEQTVAESGLHGQSIVANVLDVLQSRIAADSWWPTAALVLLAAACLLAGELSLWTLR